MKYSPLEQITKMLNLSEDNSRDLLKYPEVAIEYAVNVMIGKPHEVRNFKYLVGIIRQYCSKNGITGPNVPARECSTQEEYFAHAGKKKEHYGSGYKTAYPPAGTPPKPRGRKELIELSYPHLTLEQYDEIKSSQHYYSKKMHATKNKQEIDDISNQLYHLMTRLSGKMIITSQERE